MVFKGVSMLVSAATTAGRTGEAPAVDRDVYMTCPSCGASIPVSGNTRNEKCSHCDSSVLLPDELWHHIHPAPVKTRWFLGFETQ